MHWTIQFALATYHLHLSFGLFTDFPPLYLSLLYIPPLSAAWGLLLWAVSCYTSYWCLEQSWSWKKIGIGGNVTCIVSSEWALSALIALGLLLFAWHTGSSVLCTQAALCTRTCSPWSALELRMKVASFFSIPICFFFSFPLPTCLHSLFLACSKNYLFLRESYPQTSVFPWRSKAGTLQE